MEYRRAFPQDMWSSAKNKRSIGRDSDGQIFIGYTDYFGTYKRVRLARSPNMGIDWYSEEVPGQYPSADNRDITIAVDSDDNIIAVWYGRTSSLGYPQILYCKRSKAGVWGSVIIVADPAVGRECRWASVAIDSNDTAHICWSDSSHNGTVYDDIRYNTVDKNGILGTQLNVTNLGNRRQVESQISVCKNDIAHIVWQGTGWGANPDFYNIQYNTVAGGVLGVQVGISDRAARCDSAECVVDSDGFVHIVYFEDYQLGAEGTYYTNNTSGSFSTPTWLTVAGAVGFSITVDAEDTLYVFAVVTSGAPERYMDILTNKGAGWTTYTVPLIYEYNDVYSMWSWYPRIGSLSPNILSRGNWLAYIMWPKPEDYAYLMFPSRVKGNINIDQLIYQHAERMRTF